MNKKKPNKKPATPASAPKVTEASIKKQMQGLKDEFVKLDGVRTQLQTKLREINEEILKKVGAYQELQKIIGA